MNSFAGTLEKIQFYKRAILVFVTCNIFCLVTSAVLSVYFWQHRHTTFKDIAENHKKIELNLKAQQLVFELQGLPKEPKKQEELFAKWRLTEKLSSLKAESATVPELTASIAKSNTENVKLFKRINRYTQLLSAIGALTFIFGIVLPLIVLRLLINHLNSTKKQFESDFKNWLEKYVITRERFGPDGMQKAEFWAQILLLTFEQFGRYSRHPIAGFGVELSEIVRRELNRAA